MSTYGRRTLIHFAPSGKIDYRETTDFRCGNGKYIWGEMNDEEKAVLNRPDGYTEMWNHLEYDDIDEFDIDIYKNGNQIDSFYTNSEIFINEKRPKYIKKYCGKELAEELKQKQRKE